MDQMGKTSNLKIILLIRSIFCRRSDWTKHGFQELRGIFGGCVSREGSARNCLVPARAGNNSDTSRRLEPPF